MLKRNQIEYIAYDAAHVAYSVLGLDCKYSINFIEEPEMQFDGFLDTDNNIINLNLCVLTPFSHEAVPPSIPVEDMSPEELEIDENYRHSMKIYSVVYHEMRHLYQKRAVEIYTINQFLGGGIKPLESKKKCELWAQELKIYVLGEGSGTDVEADADDFAYYLSNRHPIKLPMMRTNRRLAAMKRKYDKVELPEGWETSPSQPQK